MSLQRGSTSLCPCNGGAAGPQLSVRAEHTWAPHPSSNRQIQGTAEAFLSKWLFIVASSSSRQMLGFWDSFGDTRLSVGLGNKSVLLELEGTPS